MEGIAYNAHIIMIAEGGGHRIPGRKPSQGAAGQPHKKPARELSALEIEDPVLGPKLLNQEITIHSRWMGQEVRGKLKGFNSYGAFHSRVEPKQQVN